MEIKLVIEEVENRSIPSVFGAAPNAMNCCCSTCTCCAV
jgi:hypothetical protein